jgi:branched-chain amino acid transport system permease protein
LAARLAGINDKLILRISFGLAAMLGALAGVLIAPISLTYPSVGVMLGLKGFCAAILGGLGNPMGAVAGGLIVGTSEAMAAGYISSAYKDAVAFVIILLVLFFLPNGLFGVRGTDRV